MVNSNRMGLPKYIHYKSCDRKNMPQNRTSSYRIGGINRNSATQTESAEYQESVVVTVLAHSLLLQVLHCKKYPITQRPTFLIYPLGPCLLLFVIMNYNFILGFLRSLYFLLFTTIWKPSNDEKIICCVKNNLLREKINRLQF